MKHPIPLMLILMSVLATVQTEVHTATRVSGQNCDDLTGMPLNQGLDYDTDIQPIFNANGCADCHDGSGGNFNLSTNNGSPLLQLLGTPSQQTGLSLIEPEFPELSYLFQKINCQNPSFGVRMPFSGGVLSLEEQGKIYDWIYAGALGEFPPGLWFRELIYRDGAESIRQ